jgi:hypothetical protein
MSNIFMVKWFIYVKLLLSVAKVHVHGLDFIFNTRSTWKLGANALFSIQEVLVLVQWYCFEIFEFWIWGYISEPAHVSYGNQQIVYNNTIGYENFSPGHLNSQLKVLWNKGKSRLLSQWRSFVLMCFSQYMLVYISFILMSIAKFQRTSHNIKSLSLDICYTT